LKTIPALEARVRSTSRVLLSMRRRVQENGLLDLAKELGKRAGHRLGGADEVLFYELPASHLRRQSTPAWSLVPADLPTLSEAAIAYDRDAETIQYLLRAAARLKSNSERGFALINAEAIPVHLCWVHSFQGFHMAELKTRLDEPASDCMMIFDCWTPAAQRGHGYYGVAIAAIAEQLLQQGKRPWIFSAATNLASIHGIEKAGFELRFSLIRRRFAGSSRIIKQIHSARSVQAGQLVSAVGR
jgi:hypothetical protein